MAEPIDVGRAVAREWWGIGRELHNLEDERRVKRDPQEVLAEIVARQVGPLLARQEEEVARLTGRVAWYANLCDETQHAMRGTEAELDALRVTILDKVADYVTERWAESAPDMQRAITAGLVLKVAEARQEAERLRAALRAIFTIWADSQNCYEDDCNDMGLAAKVALGAEGKANGRTDTDRPAGA